MNVLIYSAPDIIQTSLNHSLTTFRAVLSPHYAIQTVTQLILTTQPWQRSCALLVLPRARAGFVSTASKHIKNFVEAGGCCLILGSRVTVASRPIGSLGSGTFSFGGAEEEAAAIPLRFFDRPNSRYISIDGDSVVEEALPPHVSLRSSDGILVKGVYDSVTPPIDQFNGIRPDRRTSITAHYVSDDDEEGAVACLTLDVGSGRLALWIPNIEYPLSKSIYHFLAQSAAVKSFDTKKSKNSRYYDSNFSANLWCSSVFTYPLKITRPKFFHARFRNFLHPPQRNQLWLVGSWMLLLLHNLGHS